MPTAKFNIPFLDPTTFSIAESNNHYRILEALIHPIVISIESAPPTNPVLGAWYEVESSAPSGAFIGQGGKVATKIADYWFFQDPTVVPYHFVSSTNQYYNPAGVIKADTFFSTNFTAPNSTFIAPKYHAQFLVDCQYPGCSLNLSTIPPFTGAIAICNKGSEPLSVLFQSNITKTVPVISVATFFSDGSYVY